MKNFTVVGIVVLFTVYFGVINCFAQWNNQMQSINNPEFSKLSKGQDGLVSCTGMQTYQPPFTKTDLHTMNNFLTGWYSKYNYNSPQ